MSTSGKMECMHCRNSYARDKWRAIGKTYMRLGKHLVIECPGCSSIQRDIPIELWEKEKLNKEKLREKIREAEIALVAAMDTTKDLRKELEELKGQKT